MLGVTALAASLALLVAAPSTTFKGRTEGNQPVSFKLVDNRVQAFVSATYASCAGGFSVTSVGSPKNVSARVAGGKFTLKWTYTVGEYSGSTVVRGTISGRRASGVMELRGMCVDDEKWTARA